MIVLDAKTVRPLEGGPSFSLKTRVIRALFLLCWLLFARWTPRPANPWRLFLLRAFGARIGRGSCVYGSARIWYPPHLEMGEGSTLGPGVELYAIAPIRLGSGVIISQRAHLCSGTHDYRDPNFQVRALPIHIGDKAWICAEAFVGPGVTIGQGAVLGARTCAFRDAEPWTVYSGNPAVAIGPRNLRED